MQYVTYENLFTLMLVVIAILDLAMTFYGPHK